MSPVLFCVAKNTGIFVPFLQFLHDLISRRESVLERHLTALGGLEPEVEENPDNALRFECVRET